MELAKLHPCLKEKGRMKGRSSTVVILSIAVAAQMREAGSMIMLNEHRSLEFWSDHWNSGEQNVDQAIIAIRTIP